MPSLRMVVLGSSSSGNSTLVEAEGGSLLVDAGFSGRELAHRIHAAGGEVSDLRGIVLTHEHTDHLGGVRVMARRHGLPVYATPGTVRAASDALRGLEVHPQPYLEPFGLEGFLCSLIPVPHDATEPAAVRLDVAGRRVLVATDLGHFPFSLLEWGQDMHGLVLESNHDPTMLAKGPYPEVLKRRIRGPRGHLSNNESATALRALIGPSTRGVLLGHLSQQNNTEELAMATVTAGVPEVIRRDVDIRTTSPKRHEVLHL